MAHTRLATLMNFRNDGNVDPVIEHLEAELDEHQAAGNFEAVAKVTDTIETLKRCAKEFKATVEASVGARTDLRIALLPVGPSMSLEAKDLASLSVPLLSLFEHLKGNYDEEADEILEVIQETLTGNELVEVCVKAGGGKEVFVRDLEEDRILEVARASAVFWPPKEVSILVLQKNLYEALTAPRSLLVIVDPDARTVDFGSTSIKALKALVERAGLKHAGCIDKKDLVERAHAAVARLSADTYGVFAIDNEALETPLVDFANKDESHADDAGEAFLGKIRQTAVVRVAHLDYSSETEEGYHQRCKLVSACCDGEFAMPHVTTTVHALDATLRDATDAASPFVVLYFSGDQAVAEPCPPLASLAQTQRVKLDQIIAHVSDRVSDLRTRWKEERRTGDGEEAQATFKELRRQECFAVKLREVGAKDVSVRLGSPNHAPVAIRLEELCGRSLLEILDEAIIVVSDSSTGSSIGPGPLQTLRKLLAEGSEEFSISFSVGDAPLAPLTDFKDTVLLETPPLEPIYEAALAGPGVHPPPVPSELTIQVTNNSFLKVVAAPRCLLAVVATDPGMRTQTMQIDQRLLETSLVDIASDVLATHEGERPDYSSELREIVVAGVGYVAGADATEDGKRRRMDAMTTLRERGELPELETVHAIDATLGDATDSTAPFVILYFTGYHSHKSNRETRATLSVRDSSGGKVVCVDYVLRRARQKQAPFPMELDKLLQLLMTQAHLATSKGFRSTQGDKLDDGYFGMLDAWMSDPTTKVYISVNAATPREYLKPTEMIGADIDEAVTRVTVDFVIASLPAPSARTREEKLWLEPELACAVDAVVAAMDPLPWVQADVERRKKKVEILANLGVEGAEFDLWWLHLLTALRTISRSKVLDKPLRKSALEMMSSSPPDLHKGSASCRLFLDKHCPGLDIKAQGDALRMIVTKWVSRAVHSDGAPDLVDYAMGKTKQASGSFYSVHPHVVTTRLVFAYWISAGKDDKDERGSFKRVRFRGKTVYYRGDPLASSCRRELVEAVLRAGCYDYRDYGGHNEADPARRALADVAFLWTERFDAAAARRYEVAAAAGNELAREIVKRFASGANTSKLARKYELDIFATRHLESLPTGLARLEAAIALNDSDDGAIRARREEKAIRARREDKAKKRAERAVLQAGVSAATADATASFAVDSAAAKTGKKKQQRAKKLREEKEKKAKKKLEDERRRREAAAREEAERPAREAAARAARDAAEAAEAAEAAAREEAKREAAAREEAAREAALARAADEAAEAESEAPAEETAPDDGDWTGVRSRRERRADADAPVDPVIAAAAAAEEYYKGRAAQKLEPEDAAAPPPLAPRARRPSAYDPPPSEEESRRRADEFIASTGVAGAAADKLRSLAPDHQARLVRRLEVGAAAGADVEVLIMAADDERCAATASELAALDPSLRPVADRLALTSAAVSRLASLDSLQQQDLAYRFAEPGLLDDMRDLDQFVARAFEKEKPYESLLRAKESFMEPTLVNAIQGLAVDLSRSCVKELRALDEPTQRHAALALADIDFRGIRDPSDYVLSGLKNGSLLARVPAPAMALPATPAPEPPLLNAEDPIVQPKSPIAPPERTAPPAPAWGAAPAGPPTPAPMWGAIVPPSPTSPAPAWGAIEPPSAPPAPAWGATGPPPPPPTQPWPAPAPTSAWAPPDAFSPTAAWPAVTVETAPPPAWSAGDAMARLGAGADSDDDFVVPEGLVDVERRSNCSLDAIVAVLSQCPTFRRALGNGAEAEAAQSDALRYLGAAFRASAGGTDAEVDTAVDGLRAALAARGDQDEDGEGVRSELATGGAHLDVAEVLGEVMSVLSTSERCQKAASALRTKGHIHQRACVKCGKRNEDFREDVAFDELARSAPATALVDAARSGTGRVADVFRDAHAHAAKSCDACHAPAACEVDVILDHAAKALVLSLAWYSTDQEGDDVASLLELVWRDAPMPVEKVFSKNPNGRQRGGKAGPRKLDLFAVAVFQNAHYTAFVRAKDGSDSWTYHDRRSAVAVGPFANVVARCRAGPMLPYLLFYDALPAPPGN